MIFTDTDPRLVEEAIKLIDCYYRPTAEAPEDQSVEELIDDIRKLMTYENPLFFAWGDLMQALRDAKSRDFDRAFRRLERSAARFRAEGCEEEIEIIHEYLAKVKPELFNYDGDEEEEF